MLELKASQSRPAEAVVVEARQVKGQGPVATVIVRRGCLAPGQVVAVGMEWGKIRSVLSPGGKNLKSALPGQPAEISGLKGLPQVRC